MSYPQSGQYPAYPQYSGPTGPAPKPPVPDTVRTAFLLMLLGAAFEIVSSVVAVAQRAQVEAALAQRFPDLSQAALDSQRSTTIAETVFGAALGMALWIWMAFANRAGRNWARITGTVFFGINSFSVVIDLAISATSFGGLVTPVERITAVVGWLIGLTTVILLWNKKSSAYFKPPIPVGYGYPYGYPYPAPGQGYPAPGQQQPYGAPPQDGQPQDPWTLPPQG